MATIVNHVGLCVGDLDRARRFYEALGFTYERELEVPDGPAAALLDVSPPVGFRAVYLRLGPCTLELLHFDRDGNPPWRERAFNEPGLTHLSVAVDDLAAAVTVVTDHGGTVVRQLGTAVALVRDPDGQLLELLPLSYRDGLPPNPDPIPT